ncbi:uncharacterized protein LOC133531191 [Cydia pomonella]|uniref:uncharacterized protein LOC133531191 n=1 Tax=Cydia pomonella TaxID=82600 RepID=UPI002ADE017A|nr:uncharacterized protein LOC133531191 [Cydia pomonella]XP_061725309.1 uncharacterized protein LOC133531191 [Cydia pomonella]
MQPSKSMMDYMMELNRLFPKTAENEMHTPTTTFQSQFGQSTPNYSSSSTDSYSPESFPELSFRPPAYRSETPFAIAKRPIVGRKILGNSEQKPIERSSYEERFSLERSPISHWREQTPPRTTAIEQQNCTKSFYELFPGDNRGFEFKTPVKTSPLAYSNISPASSMSQNSPSNFNMFTYPRLNLANSPTPTNMNIGASTSRFPEVAQKMCSFCRKNGETPLVYMTHCVKEKRGNMNIVTCPILRSHVCSTCGVSGDNAHTITYCPVLRSTNNGVPLKSTTITLKNTRIKSNGRRRY